MARAARVTKIELNHKDIAAFMQGPEVTADVQRRARMLAARAGDGFEVVETGRTGQRSYADVAATTYAARKAESKDKALTRALGAMKEG